MPSTHLRHFLRPKPTAGIPVHMGPWRFQRSNRCRSALIALGNEESFLFDMYHHKKKISLACLSPENIVHQNVCHFASRRAFFVSHVRKPAATALRGQPAPSSSSRRAVRAALNTSALRNVYLSTLKPEWDVHRRYLLVFHNSTSIWQYANTSIAFDFPYFISILAYCQYANTPIRQ